MANTSLVDGLDTVILSLWDVLMDCPVVMSNDPPKLVVLGFGWSRHKSILIWIKMHMMLNKFTINMQDFVLLELLAALDAQGACEKL